MELGGEGAIAGPVWLSIDHAGRGRRPAGVLLEPGGGIVLGSAPPSLADGSAHVDDAAVSGRHCRIEHTGRTIEVSDLGSRNGLRVGGVRVPRASLLVGCAFEIGRTTVHIEPTSIAPETACPLPGLVGGSAVMLRLAGAARKIAGLRLPALLRGESGTGKDLVARAIHEESARSRRPFVAINAATISRELAESELFGHRRGAFTGAVRDRRGAFREAEGGTLFLDEIGAVPLDVQVKLLRAVEEGVVRPLGSESSCPVDVRLIVATCEPLEEMVEERRFRADLYERLAVCILRVPPLRDRLDDVPSLARHLLAASELGGRELSPGALGVLRAQRWPGNVRELRNVVVQAAVRSGGRVLAEHVAQVISERSMLRRRLLPEDALRIFEEMGRNVSAAARKAEVPRTTMRDLLRSAGVGSWPNGSPAARL